MIDMERQEITQGDKTEKIKAWEVWFLCPLGITPVAEQAIEMCKALDMDPRVGVMPIPIAKGDTLEEMSLASK